MPDRPMRVAVVITRLEGGAGRMALRGARALDPSRYEITLVSGNAGALADEAAAAGLEIVVAPRLRTPIAPVDDVLAVRGLRALFARRKFDVVHTHCAKAGVLGRIAARRAGVRRIVHTYHGFPFHEFQRTLPRRCYVTVERLLGRITDLALCVGTGVAVEAIRRELIAPHRVGTIGVPVDPDTAQRTRATRTRARQLLELPSDAVVVGTVGRLTYQKAPEDFAATVHALRGEGAVGVWIGGPDRRVPRVGTTSNMRLAGHRDDVRDLLPAFDVFVLPSRYEGVPLAVVEAMLCGVPVVATAVNAVGDVVVPGRTGVLVPPRRPDLMAEAVRYLLESPRVAARMSAEARERARAYCGTESLAEALAVAYSEDGPEVWSR